MKKLTLLLGALALFVSAFADGNIAIGQGIVEGGSHAGSHFKFNVRVPENPQRPNRFLFFDHGMFVPVHIEVHHFREIRFGAHQMHFTGRGRMNNAHPVNVAVWVLDGGNAHPDRFRMVARNLQGTVVHTAEGAVIQGGIFIQSK